MFKTFYKRLLACAGSLPFPRNGGRTKYGDGIYFRSRNFLPSKVRTGLPRSNWLRLVHLVVSSCFSAWVCWSNNRCSRIFSASPAVSGLTAAIARHGGNPGRLMNHAHGAGSLVHVLAARAFGAHDVHPHVLHACVPAGRGVADRHPHVPVFPLMMGPVRALPDPQDGSLQDFKKSRAFSLSRISKQERISPGVAAGMLSRISNGILRSPAP